MLLAVDIGNTNTKVGLFEGDRLVERSSVPTSSEAYSTELSGILERISRTAIPDVLACSVVPAAEAGLISAVYSTFDSEPDFVRSTDDFGLEIRYRPAGATGTDRLVNAYSAVERYGVPCIVCSFGTATTFDVINERRILLGGAIAPGLATMAVSLSSKTAQLPNIDIAAPDTPMGRDTVGSIRAGIYYSQVGLVNELVSRYRSEIGSNAKVIATGGFASLIAGQPAAIDTVDEDLLLEGLRLLHGA